MACHLELVSLVLLRGLMGLQVYGLCPDNIHVKTSSPRKLELV